MPTNSFVPRASVPSPPTITEPQASSFHTKFSQPACSFCSSLCSFTHSCARTCTCTPFPFCQEPATSHPDATCRALRPQSRAASRSSTPLAVYMDAALILQNKGGGHGEVGFHLAKQLKAKVRPLDLAPFPKKLSLHTSFCTARMFGTRA
jgi:hypothetical protein